MDEAAKQRLRVKQESYKANIDEELSLRKRRKEIRQAQPWRHWAAGEWCWYWRSGKHKVFFLGPHVCYFKNAKKITEGVRMKGVVGHRGYFSCSVCCTALAFPFRVRERIVQFHGHRSHELPSLRWTSATQTDARDCLGRGRHWLGPTNRVAVCLRLGRKRVEVATELPTSKVVGWLISTGVQDPASPSTGSWRSWEQTVAPTLDASLLKASIGSTPVLSSATSRRATDCCGLCSHLRTLVFRTCCTEVFPHGDVPSRDLALCRGHAGYRVHFVAAGSD